MRVWFGAGCLCRCRFPVFGCRLPASLGYDSRHRLIRPIACVSDDIITVFRLLSSRVVPKEQGEASSQPGQGFIRRRTYESEYKEEAIVRKALKETK